MQAIKYIFLSFIRALIKSVLVSNILVESVRESNNFAGMFFILLVVNRAFYKFNRRAKINFMEKYIERIKYSKVRMFFCSLISIDFLIDTAICLFAAQFLMILYNYDDVEHLNSALILFAIVNFFTVYDLRRRWAKKWERKHSMNLKKRPFLLEAVLEYFAVFGYSCVILIASSWVIDLLEKYVPKLYILFYHTMEYFLTIFN